VIDRESSLLLDPSQDDVKQRLWISTVICHEIVHQWFGNLVTPSDWTELWLKEGFATYFENLGAQVGKEGPSWPRKYNS